MVVVGLAVVGGLLLLAVAPDRFVAGSAAIADRWGASRVMIGAVIIGFGTSTPEMLVSGVAATRGEPEVGVGNVIGSNMANISLIVGVAALIAPLAVPTGLLRRELPLTIMATLFFALAVQTGLRPIEGLLLLGSLGPALWFLVRRAGSPNGPDAELADEVGEYLTSEQQQPSWRLTLDIAGGLIGTLAGAQLLVWGAVEIAARADLSDGFVGLTLVALGTSLPELVTAISAARAGEDQLILGNVLGSNLFNSLAVGGIIGLTGPGHLDDTNLTVTAVVLMLAVTALGAAAMTRRKTVTRGEAATLVTTYLAALPLLA